MPMMGDESKKAALIIIGKKPKPEGEEAIPAAGEEGLDVAAEEVLKAVQGGSALGLKAALKNFVEICGSSHEASEGESEY